MYLASGELMESCSEEKVAFPSRGQSKSQITSWMELFDFSDRDWKQQLNGVDESEYSLLGS